MLKTLNIFFLLFSISFSNDGCDVFYIIENPNKLEYRDAANDNSNRILKEKNALFVENDKLFNKLIILRGEEQKDNVENLKINWLNYIKAKAIYKNFESEGRQAYCPAYNSVLVEEIRTMNNFLNEELTMP